MPNKMRQVGNWWPGDFQRLVTSLNPRLRIIRGKTDDRFAFASIYFWEPEFDVEGGDEYRSLGNWRQVCGVSTNWIPERTIRDENGRIYKRGWRETLNILSGKYIRIPAYLGGKARILSHGVPQKINEVGKLEAVLS